MTEELRMPRLIEVLQHWLQGQMNECVAGYEGRLSYLEQRNRELAEQVEKLIAEIKTDKVGMDRSTFNDWFEAQMEDYWNHNSVVEMLDSGDVWNLIDGNVDDAIDEKLDDFNVDGLTDKVKEVVREELTFEVTVS